MFYYQGWFLAAGLIFVVGLAMVRAACILGYIVTLTYSLRPI